MIPARRAAFALCAAAGAALAARAGAQSAAVHAPTAPGGGAPTTGAPRYADAVQHEFAAMGLDAVCSVVSATRATCNYRVRSSATGRDLPAHAIYDDDTDSVYFYVERYLVAPAQAASTPSLLRRLMELNWTLLVGKFEWNPRDGEVRLGAVLNTDSNFDRRAFRSIVLALDTTAARYREELRALQDGARAR